MGEVEAPSLPRFRFVGPHGSLSRVSQDGSLPDHTGTGSDFRDPDGMGREALLSYGLSIDQALGEVLGAFLRLSWQREAAVVDYRALYSGGIQAFGSAWGREADTVGLAYAYLDGGNLDVRHTHVLEGYYRVQITDIFAVSADVQYLRDAIARIGPDHRDPEGWIFGLRATAAF